MKSVLFPVALAVATALSATAGSSSALAQSLQEEWMNNIPAGHPRLLWDEEALAEAQQWYESHPFTPSSATNPVFSSSDPAGNALRNLLSGDESTCQVAYEWSMNALDTLETWTGGHATCDECRWYGEGIILTYDWCYNALAPAQRQALEDAGNEIFPSWLGVRWGGPDMVENNYFWGYWRNALLWAVATHGSGSLPGELFYDALVTRWQENWLPHCATCNQGGVPAEGSSYGPYLLRYPIIGLQSLAGFGRDLVEETDFYKRAVFFVLYNTLPNSHHDPSGSATGWDIFPYGDAAGGFMDAGTSPALNGNAAAFMAWAALRWPTTAVGAYARRWLADTDIKVPVYLEALLDRETTAQMADLPLDFHAPGCSSHSIVRTSWTHSESVVHMQLATPPMVGHEHQDTGSFQIWRNGRWLVREAAGRGVNSGWRVPGYGGTGMIDVHRTPAHNVLLVAPEATGGGMASTEAGTAEIRRLTSQPTHFYAVSDLTPAYHSSDDDSRYGNPEAAHVERELLFVRPLETLIILDRVDTRSADATAAFLMHVPGAPVATGNRHTLTSGSEQLVLDTLLPAAPTTRVIDENREDDLHRIEQESPPGTMHYFLHVAQAKSLPDAAVSTQLEPTADGYLLTITHPSKGTALFRFKLGTQATGGQFAFQQTGTPNLQDLPEIVEGYAVDDAGPRWLGGGEPAPTLSVGDVVIEEGDSGTVNATISVTLTRP